MNRTDILKQIAENKKKIKDSVKKGFEDNRDKTFWLPPWDQNTQTGSAVIAFLPFSNMFLDEADKNFEIAPYVFVPEHSNMTGTRGKKYWGILCRSIFGRGECPICNKFWEYWNSSEEDKNFAKGMGISRKRSFVGNIIVIDNKNNPSENGTVFKWKFGIRIKERIDAKISPRDPNEPSQFVYNPSRIVPFKVNIIESGGFRDYGQSEWLTDGKSIADWIMPEATKAEKTDFIDNLPLYSVQDIIKKEYYKSYEEVEIILNDVLRANGVKVSETVKKPKELKTVSDEAPEDELFGGEIEVEEDKIQDEDLLETEEEDSFVDGLFDDERTEGE